MKTTQTQTPPNCKCHGEPKKLIRRRSRTDQWACRHSAHFTRNAERCRRYKANRYQLYLGKTYAGIYELPEGLSRQEWYAKLSEFKTKQRQQLPKE